MHGKCLICYLICRIFSSIIANLYLVEQIDYVFIGCYFLLCSVQWLQVISFDMWWNLRGSRLANQLNHLLLIFFYPISVCLSNINRYIDHPSRSSERKRFLFYFIYALFSPFIVILLVFVVIRLPIIKPLVYVDGRHRHWWSTNLYNLHKIYEFELFSDIETRNKRASIVYYIFSFPIIIVFFTLTIRKIHREQRNIGRLSLKDDNFFFQNKLKLQREKWVEPNYLVVNSF